jgi:hypothetical protein
MTAGQGPGPYGSPAGEGGPPEQPESQGGGAPQGQPPYGQPQYGQPPYGQPPYGHPQYGQPPYGQPPYGQPSYYPGYGPAPSAPREYGAPEPVDRPVTVRAGIGAFVASILLSLVGQVISLFNLDELTAAALADADADLGELSPEEAEFASGLIGTIGPAAAVAGLIFTAVFALFVWFAWKGHNWARVLLWVLAGLGLLLAPITLAAGGPLPVLTFLAAFEALADLAAVVLLALKPSNEWYRYRRWLRATGQRG